MSGLNKLALLVFITACSSGLAGQFLPDINQFEVENVRLILLDDAGRRVGVLSGDLARKQRDGKVQVENAGLKVERDNGVFNLTAAEFNYTPSTHDFDCPSGLTATLPDGGVLRVPKGSGRIEFADGVKFELDVDGEATLKGDETRRSPVDAKLINPKIAVTLTDKTAAGSSNLSVDTISISGTRGGELKLRLASMPALGQKGSDTPAVASVSCFGDISLTVKENATLAELHLLRRARMALDGDDGKFEVTSNLLDVRGTIEQIAPDPKKPDDKQTVVSDLAIDASQTVSLRGDDFEGTCGTLRYREFGTRREVRLETGPALTLRQGVAADGRTAEVSFRARDYVDVQVPEIVSGKPPLQILSELSEGAHVRRSLGNELQWQITGRLIRLHSSLDEAIQTETTYNHSFDTYAEGYSPLLRVLGVHAEGGLPGQPELQRAAVYGSRAVGSFVTGLAKVRVYGPEILGVVMSDAPLSDLMKIGIGLMPPYRDENRTVVSPPLQNGSLTVRADSLLDLELSTSAGNDISLAASGNVQFDHTPLPRDDTRFVSLSGENVALQTRDGALVSAHLEAPTGADALATLGFDLLICRSIDLSEQAAGFRTRMTGPGRVIVRDKDSVAYFRNQLDRLPKLPESDQPRSVPDAAWLNFGANFLAEEGVLSRTLEVDTPDFHLVSGDFERARAGRSAINDLAELIDPEVLLLYRMYGQRLFASSSRSSETATPVNVLRLETDAFLNSRLDGITAFAREAIELSGSENQKAEDAPLSVVLLKDARLRIDDAGVFFGDYVRSGVFAYDGSWTLESSDRLEVTFRPLNAPLAGGDELTAARDTLSAALKPGRHTLDRARLIELGVHHLRNAIAGIKRPASPGADQPWEALAEAEDAERAIHQASIPWLLGNRGPFPEPTEALRATRRARALLAALVDVVGSGGVTGRFEASRLNVPSLNLSMQEALFTFDGLSQIVDVVANGPINVTRGPYTITGKRLSRAVDGTLTVTNANITLPPDTGVAIEGVREVALRQHVRGSIGSETRVTRTMVTRVSGKKLKVSVKLADSLELK